MSSSTEDLTCQIRQLDRKFRRACDQILLLNNQIEDLQTRYDRAMKANRRSFRYSLRLRLATLEGVRNMFYEYASRCADELEELQNQLIEAGEDPDELDTDDDNDNADRSNDNDTFADDDDEHLTDNDGGSGGGGSKENLPLSNSHNGLLS
ncbi:hypothetical protein LSAT2_008627 [Lamellibrachia satsuma]|nr:hypothetical protein LSAT2_008627 [Lamellibrachia satsuma]